MARTPSSSRRRAVIAAAACALATVALWAAAAPAAVDYPDFSSTAGLKLNGDAAQNGDLLRVTADAPDQAGTAFTNTAVVKPGKNFKTHFQISQHDSSSFPGDGMAFVIQSKGKSQVGDLGGGLGYGGIPHSLIVEFDIFNNDDSEPHGSNHIGLMKNGRAGDHLEAEDPGFALFPNAPYIWVNYTAKSKTVKVWAATSDIKPDEPLFSHKINLKDILDGKKGFAGFTGATGGANAQQDVFSWTLKSG